MQRATSGGLASYGAEAEEEYARAADYIDRIFKGESPGNLPVRSTKFQLVLNLKTAQMLGIRVPAELRHLADEVIE